MKKLALLLSLLALGALGLVACGGGDDDEGTPAEAKVSPDTTAEARFPAKTTTEACSLRIARQLQREGASLAYAIRRCSRKLSPQQVHELERGKQVQELRRAANDWASLFATNNCNRYMGQPLCERLLCAWQAVGPIKNCTPVSKAFQRSFADATVEDIKFKGVRLLRPSYGPPYLAAVTFSNGEVVVFSGGGPEPPAGSCAGAGSGCVWNVAEPGGNRRFFQAAAPRE